ncbi:MAG: iron ABC transporter permease [Polyangiales bacterium]
MSVVIDREGKGSVWRQVGLVGLLLVALASSLLLGRYPIAPRDVVATLARAFALPVHDVSPQVETVVLFIRLPRVLIAGLVGMSLSLAGAAFQGLFRNPIVSPDLLGASAGAGFGACLGILLSLGEVAVQLLAFGCGGIAVLLAYAVSVACGRGTLPLLLAGIAVSALFSAFIALTKLAADPANKLPAITFWLMGALGNVSLRDVPALAIASVIGALPLFLLRWRLNVVALGEEQALALGVDRRVLQPIVVASATLLTAASVAVCGMVGWVGLLVPNIARGLVGPRFDRLLPASALLGASFVLTVDCVSRSLLATELPIGVTLALLGAPFLLVMLGRSARGRR